MTSSSVGHPPRETRSQCDGGESVLELVDRILTEELEKDFKAGPPPPPETLEEISLFDVSSHDQDERQ